MEALFIGQTYIDVTFIADQIPTGDDKGVAHDYAISFGGNAVTAAFCCARLGIVPDLLTSLADDWLGRMFLDMAAKYQIPVHARKVRRSSLSFVMPNGGKRAILRLRDDAYLHPFPPLNIEGCRGLHLDGHQSTAALHYAKACREAGVFTSLDGGGVRSNTMELLPLIDAAVVSERFCEQLHLSPTEVLALLKEKGCGIGAVTMGERGLLWYDEKGVIACLPALMVPKDHIVDTNGAGDVFHGAYVYSRMKNPDRPWESHFRFARAASAHAIRFLGNEARLPALADIDKVEMLYRPVT
jgi:sugar/nucleoside kinase (ribokinase family)